MYFLHIVAIKFLLQWLIHKPHYLHITLNVAISDFPTVFIDVFCFAFFVLFFTDSSEQNKSKAGSSLFLKSGHRKCTNFRPLLVIF